MEIQAQIEAILFISARPMSVKKLSVLLAVGEDDIKKACEELFADYSRRTGGLRIARNGDDFQMVTAGNVSEVIKKFIKDETTGELSRPSLETLTIIAYRGPVSKTDLDKIRGVNCSLILRNLLVRGLVEAKEKGEEAYYSASLDLLKFLGIASASELPDYERLSQDDCIDRILAGGEEKGSSAN